MQYYSFDTLSDVVHRLLKYSTPFGHAWVAITFLCRLLPGTTIGEGVYGDEFDNFECVTTQPGCSQVCFNLFAPMSHPRFWSMQILLLCFPSMIFAMVATQFNAKYQVVKARIESKNADDTTSEYVTSGAADKDQKFYSKFKVTTRQNLEEGESEEVVWAPMLRLAYMIHLFAKLFLEIIFIYFLYYLQSFQHPEGTSILTTFTVPFKYSCRPQDHNLPAEMANACSQTDMTPCWVQRPWEKRMFLGYMLFMSLVSVIICFLDFNYVAFRVTTKHRRRRQKKRIVKEALLGIPEEVKEA